MKTRWQELRSKYWNNRTAKDRRIIILLCTLVFPLVFYYLLWQPAHRAVEKLHVTLPILQAQTIKLHDQATEVDLLHHRPEVAALDVQSLTSVITDSASRHQIRELITSLEAQKTNGIRITCDAITFAKWIAWLRDLEQEQHIRADAISISSLPQAGMVKVSATLINGGIQ